MRPFYGKSLGRNVPDYLEPALKGPAIPADEESRLAALAELGVLYTPSEERFDRFTRVAARTFGVPIALVTLIGRDVQWFKSSVGVATPETSRQVSFCGHAILAEDAFIVEDATKDDRFFDNPLVTDNPNISFYAGQPLHAADGSRVGTLCLIDREPRHFDDEDRELLRGLADLVEAELQRSELNSAQGELIRERDEFQRKALIDNLTGIWNRAAIFEIAAKECARALAGRVFSVAMIDVDHFKACNDSYGHPTGDVVLAEIAARLSRGVRDFDAIGRYGGEEFLAILGKCDATDAAHIGERIRRAVCDSPIATGAGPVAITVSIGMATYGAELGSVDALIAAADRALYRAKAEGRNRVGTSG